MVQVDIASLTAVTHIFAQDMRKRGRGKILLVASLLAYQGVENFAVIPPPKPMCCAWVRRCTVNSSAMALR